MRGMAPNDATEGSASERRRHARIGVVAPILVSPSSHPHPANLVDLSEGGARIGLPERFEHGVGALLRLHFPREREPGVIFAEVRRMGPDHFGVEFAEGQSGLVHELMGRLVGRY